MGLAVFDFDLTANIVGWAYCFFWSIAPLGQIYENLKLEKYNYNFSVEGYNLSF